MDIVFSKKIINLFKDTLRELNGISANGCQILLPQTNCYVM
jgi:hypothetical protein